MWGELAINGGLPIGYNDTIVFCGTGGTSEAPFVGLTAGAASDARIARASCAHRRGRHLCFVLSADQPFVSVP